MAFFIGRHGVNDHPGRVQPGVVEHHVFGGHGPWALADGKGDLRLALPVNRHQNRFRFAIVDHQTHQQRIIHPHERLGRACKGNHLSKLHHHRLLQTRPGSGRLRIDPVAAVDQQVAGAGQDGVIASHIGEGCASGEDQLAQHDAVRAGVTGFDGVAEHQFIGVPAQCVILGHDDITAKQ